MSALRRPAASVRVRVIDTTAELSALAGRWEALQESAAITSIFASFDWQHEWWRIYGKGQPLRVLVASDGGDVVGIAPLYVQTLEVLHRPVRLLRWVGMGGDTSPDDLGPILAAGREAEIAAELAAAVLALPDWDVLALTDMDPNCAFTQAITAAVKRARLGWLAGRCERITYLTLPATWEAWLASLKGDRRYRIKKMRKKLEAAHPDARFFVWSDPATLDAGVDALAELHNKRWRAIGSTDHGFSSPEYIAFHRAVMHACMARDRLRLYCLELSGRIVAMYYFYKFRDRVYLMQSGFDPDLGNVKPGSVLLGRVVEHAIGERHAVLDFLRGDHQYKEELATGERETVFLTAFRLRAGAAMYLVRRIVLPRLKARITHALGRRAPAAQPAT